MRTAKVLKTQADNGTMIQKHRTKLKFDPCVHVVNVIHTKFVILKVTTGAGHTAGLVVKSN